ncbi:hypothetical protein [Dyadobacter sp. CY323]|uniref:hypothetical protein n=1 Tax=Dyadobacter sp. CY323 TaxID=2907302 RepID=UPI001F3B9D9D|nr:hypothetical protein [Dyadobacter sp. CY323]MCE6990172.1 hypothetical protein [Dyadobacter sp. CY323]
MAKDRVRMRVSEGGHDIAPEVIERRYIKGIKNLYDIYLTIVDNVFIIDNSFEKEELIAEKLDGLNLKIIEKDKYDKLRNYYEHN